MILALGANLGDRLSNLRYAVGALSSDVTLDRASSVYETSPVGPDQPDFLNAVVSGLTSLTPEGLLDRVQSVEYDAGRRRRVVGGPRTLDIDILFFGALIIQSPLLTVPHPRWSERAFVRIPLIEVEPDWLDPVGGRPVHAVCLGMSGDGVRRFADPSVLESEF